jgi:hypothetical protein
MAYQNNRPVKVPAKGDAPAQKIGPTPAPTKKYQNPILVERQAPTGYGMSKNLGPSSVEPGTTLNSPLADELKRVNALGDGGDHLQDIIEHGTARDSMVDLASLQTRPYDDKQDVPTAHGQRSRTANKEGGTVPAKCGTSEAPPVRKPN